MEGEPRGRLRGETPGCDSGRPRARSRRFLPPPGQAQAGRRGGAGPEPTPRPRGPAGESARTGHRPSLARTPARTCRQAQRRPHLCPRPGLAPPASPLPTQQPAFQVTSLLKPSKAAQSLGPGPAEANRKPKQGNRSKTMRAHLPARCSRAGHAAQDALGDRPLGAHPRGPGAPHRPARGSPAAAGTSGRKTPQGRAWGRLMTFFFRPIGQNGVT